MNKRKRKRKNEIKENPFISFGPKAFSPSLSFLPLVLALLVTHLSLPSSRHAISSWPDHLFDPVTFFPALSPAYTRWPPDPAIVIVCLFFLGHDHACRPSWLRLHALLLSQ